MLHFKMSQLQIKVICGNVLTADCGIFNSVTESLSHQDLSKVKLSHVTDVDGLQCSLVSQ
jgi:hypothetical protein